MFLLSPWRKILGLVPRGGQCRSLLVLSISTFIQLLLWGLASWQLSKKRNSQISPFLLVPNQINPVHAVPSYSFNIYFNIISPSTLKCPYNLFLSGLQTNNLMYFSHVRYMLRQSQALNFVILVVFSKGNKIWTSLLRNFYCTSCHFFQLRSKYSP